MDDEMGNDRERWGTWEELVLGGAVVRHGYMDWNSVASELQARTLNPSLFTPQVCKSKFEDLQERYSGSSSWFEELRKRRVEELRKVLEKSEDSIGSLETKLDSLKDEKGTCNNGDYSSSQTESPVFLKSEGNESSGKEAASKDGLSAGSSTQETQLIVWSPQCEADNTKAFSEDTKRKHKVLDWSQQCDTDSTKALTEDTKRKVEVEEKFPRLEKFPSIDKLEEAIRSEGGVSIRRRRGKRRGKDLSNNSNGKEGSVGESSLDIGVSAILNKEVLTCENEQPAILPPEADGQKPCTSKRDIDAFIKILDSIMENEHASVFRRRLDSQKRARYKKMIREHMDLDTIRARIKKRSITSLVELHRDLLLLANNALLFYSKSTREYKCAFMLRDLVTKKVHKHHSKPITNTNINKAVNTAETPMCKPPAKPRSVRPFKEAKKGLPSNVDSPSSAESSAVVKKSQGRKGKVGQVRRASAGLQAETPMKVRKRARVK